jgi:asparagine synthase (glutamine-hydrolysing)
LYGDKMSMAHSLEARVPMLDLELVDFVERVPLHLRLRGWRGHKYLYRQAIADWVPQEIMSRRKIGFATPIDKWFRDDRGKYLKERLLSTHRTRTGLSCQFTEQLIDDHVEGRENNARGLYVLLALAAWEKAFLDQQSAIRTVAVTA